MKVRTRRWRSTSFALAQDGELPRRTAPAQRGCRPTREVRAITDPYMLPVPCTLMNTADLSVPELLANLTMPSPDRVR
ncbi:hypothetical protein [Candidatus Aalborgicola defluviihabitans]|uniref:hypothetical protein n=1 Tax=Candidatus Aalborgicola defluviihabitans TaxID=3386187 RepID=UPI0039B9232E